MPNPDRGAYTPPTDQQPLSFDARQPVRGRGPAPMMLIVSALVLAVLVGAIVIFYRTGLSQGSGAPPTVGEPIGQIRGAPPPGAQPVDPAQGLQIYQQSEGQEAPTAPNFVPPPETPQASAAPPELKPVIPNSPPPAAPPQAAPPQPAPAMKVVTEPTPPPAGAKPELRPAAPAIKPAPVAAKPAPAPAKAPPPATKPAPTAAKPAAPAAASGGFAVQIGAFSSQALADKGWNDAAKVAPGMAAGKGKHVEAIAKNGGTLYRTQVTGFGTREQAQAFCGALKAAGKNCFVK